MAPRGKRGSEKWTEKWTLKKSTFGGFWIGMGQGAAAACLASGLEIDEVEFLSGIPSLPFNPCRGDESKLWNTGKPWRFRKSLCPGGLGSLGGPWGRQAPPAQPNRGARPAKRTPKAIKMRPCVFGNAFGARSAPRLRTGSCATTFWTSFCSQMGTHWGSIFGPGLTSSAS